MIPKIIHYVWVNSDRRKPLPTQVEAFLANVKQYCPSYQIMSWNEFNFPPTHSNITNQAFNNKNYPLFTDFLKLWALYNYGGIFLDIDVQVLRPLDTLLHNKVFFGWKSNKVIGTSIIGSEKGNKYIGDLLKYYEGVNYLDYSSKGDIENLYLSNKVTEDLTNKPVEGINLIPQILLYPDPNLPVKSYTYTKVTNTDSSRKVDFSVVIPIKTYNTLLESCLGSLLNIKKSSIKFEIIVVENYPHSNQRVLDKLSVDPRLKYLKLNGKYVSTALAINEGIVNAIGSHIILLDGNELVPKDFFTELFNILNHPCCRGTQVTLLSKLTNKHFYYKVLDNKDDLKEMVTYNLLVLSNSLKKVWGNSRYFNDHFDDCLVSEFILNTLTKGLKVSLAPTRILNKDKLLNYNQRVYQTYDSKAEVDGELTCVIVFANEGLEVENTVKSIRATSDKRLPIILIDDASDDGYDYKSIAKKFNCTYHKNEVRLGSAGSKNLGGNLVRTSYLCFFDAHQRLFHRGWDTFAINILRDHPNWLLSPRTSYMRLSEYYPYCIEEEAWSEKQAKGVSMGCKLIFNGGFAYEPKWADKIIDKVDPVSTPCSCVLGACYVMTKIHWDNMIGLEGLSIYGLEEPFMSIKTWLLGGQCRIIKNWSVGHLYRKSRNNGVSIPVNSIDLNRYILINFFGGPDKDKYIEELKSRRGEQFFNDRILQPYNQVKIHLEEVREKFFQKAKYQDLSYFNKCINSLYQ